MCVLEGGGGETNRVKCLSGPAMFDLPSGDLSEMLGRQLDV